MTARQQRGRDERGSVQETQMKHEVCTETGDEDGSSTEATAPPPTDSFRQKTISICSPINVRLPPAPSSVTSRCESTRRTSQTCQTGRERGLGLTWKTREQRARQTNNMKLLAQSLGARHPASKLLRENHSEAPFT